jgi:MFS family permease
MRSLAGGSFRSLSNRNFRLWVGSSLFSNIGTWMQGTAQNWLVLTELTDHSASAVGIITALQFLPQLLLVAITGALADHFDRRKLLIAVQCCLGVIAMALGIATISGHVQLWHVYIFGFLLGCGMAFDSPARHSFISELVGEEGIGNAVAINSTAFQLARTAGPAIAGLCIALVGTGWVFIINGLSYIAVITGLLRIQVKDLHRHEDEGGGRRRMRFLDGFRYVRDRPDLRTVFMMLFFMGTLGMNFGIFIGVMSVAVFHKGASEYGALTSVMAIGSVIGALMAARRDRPRMQHLIGGTFLFGCSMLLAALAPSYLAFGVVLLAVGFSVQTMNTSANGFVQLSTAPAMRGRVMAIYVAIMLGGLPIGAPLVGWVTDHFGPRAAMGLGACAGFVSTAIGLAYLMRVRGLRLRRVDGRLRVRIEPDPYQPA